MTRRKDIPDIMQTGRLRKLNEYAIQKIGTPLFFYAPDLLRPSSTCAGGLFFEVVTGLYVIYKDYGIKIFLSFLYFCREKGIIKYNPLGHYYAVMNFRGGLCHGYLPGGVHQSRMLKSISFYYYGQDREWPTYFQYMENRELTSITSKLKTESNKLVEQITDSIDVISENDSLLMEWRRTLVDVVFNPDTPRYGNQYFDGRIVADIEIALRKQNEGKPYSAAVVRWLTDVKKMLLDGTISNSEELYTSLKESLAELYRPTTSAVKSSASILLEDFLLD